jgi:hypothetical protein
MRSNPPVVYSLAFTDDSAVVSEDEFCVCVAHLCSQFIYVFEVGEVVTGVAVAESILRPLG